MNINDPMRNESLYDQDRLERYVWNQQQQTGHTRREILKKLFGATVGVATVGALTGTARAADPPIVKPTPADKFRTLGTNRETLFEALKGVGYVTPASLFFIRNHTSTPRIDATTWKLSIEGPGVVNPRTFTLDQLNALPQITLTRFIECAGNGRSFYDTQQGQAGAGTAWRLGAIGVGEWTGVRLSDLLSLAGLKNSAVDILPQGLDDVFAAAGIRPSRPLPIQRAVDDDVLVVTKLNGEPLPPDHGFPARLLVPGWIGIANIKWLGSITVSEQPLFNYFNTTQYTFRGGNYTEPYPLLSTQVVKSAFELPFPATLNAGVKLITGRSWSAYGKISRVEVSFNDGNTWTRAIIKPSGNDSQAWAEWQVQWRATAGNYGLKARAFDEYGNTQPVTTPFNSNGYQFDAIVRHPVKIS